MIPASLAQAIGAAACGLAVLALVLASHGERRVARRLARISTGGPARRPTASLLALPDAAGPARGLAPVKVLTGLLGALAAALAGVVLPLGPLPVVVCGYAGFVLPTIVEERRAAGRRAQAEAGVGRIVEWLEALVASGRPPEAAVAALAPRGAGAPLLDATLRSAAAAYALGAPLFPSLAAEADLAGIPALATLARQLHRSRDQGRGSLITLREQRDALRARERARVLDAASQVEGRLTLVLVLCHLPALMLLVVVPLFLTVLRGLELTGP